MLLWTRTQRMKFYGLLVKVNRSRILLLLLLLLFASPRLNEHTHTHSLIQLLQISFRLCSEHTSSIGSITCCSITQLLLRLGCNELIIEEHGKEKKVTCVHSKTQLPSRGMNVTRFVVRQCIRGVNVHDNTTDHLSKLNTGNERCERSDVFSKSAEYHETVIGVHDRVYLYLSNIRMILLRVRDITEWYWLSKWHEWVLWVSEWEKNITYYVVHRREPQSERYAVAKRLPAVQQNSKMMKPVKKDHITFV